MKSRVALLPCFHLGMFVGRVVVANDMYLFALRDISFDQVQELDPLLMPVLLLALSDDVAVCDV